MNILVTGGAGYIGSHVALNLKRKGYNPIIIDNYSRSSRTYAKKYLNKMRIIEGSMGDKDKLEKILNRYNIEGIMHFAAYAYVGESTEKSMMYYNNNVAESINFFNNLDSFYKQKRKKVPPIIFSSTCSVYGNTNAELISEESRTGPLKPYGRSK